MAPINYRTIFKKPIIINSVADIILPFSIELRRALLMIPTAVLLVVLDKALLQFIFPLIHHTTVTFLYYGVGIYFISGWLSDEYDLFDNKNLLFFLINYLKYVIHIQAGKRVVTNNAIVQELSNSIRFSKAKL